jgi:small subunit ribosomal protein S17
MNQASQSMRRTLEGRVLSDKMQNTVTVLIERRVKHPVIGKVITRSRKYHVHDDGLGVATGDLVQIEECAPISKTKAWCISKLIEKARVV